LPELHRKLQSAGVFNFSKDNYKQAKVVLLGAPMDYTVSFKVGSRFGPQGIRNASYGLEEYSPYLNRHLSKVPFFDQGDLVLAIGNVAKSLDMIYAATKQIIDDDKVPFILGGEHLITYPIIQAIVEKHPDLVVLHFDAHADLRDTFFGEKNSHATVIRRVAEILGKGRIYQYAVRSGEQYEFQYAEEMTHMRRYDVLTALEQDIENLKEKPVYITFDIDSIDPAFCPGTGTPEPCGISTTEAMQSIHLLRGLDVVGMDLVEVSPSIDTSGSTEITAAKLIREAILSYWW